MIYESDTNTIILDKEVENIKNYLEVIKLRFSVDDNIKITINENGKFTEKKIAPLLLLPFVENSIKHGISSSMEGWIDIELDLSESFDYNFYFKVKNSKAQSSENSIETDSGIGLKNVTKRLELIYPENYILDIVDSDDTYEIELKLKLT
jgi:LytS/YehU family sensor histidine kinase